MAMADNLSSFSCVNVYTCSRLRRYLVLLSDIVLSWVSLSFFVSDHIVVELFKYFLKMLSP